MNNINFNIVLVNPEIPQNTGSIGRLAVATNCRLHIVGKPGFTLDEKAVRRAGLDYWQFVQVQEHPDIKTFFESIKEEPIFLFTKRGEESLFDFKPTQGGYLVFGGESFGLPDWIQNEYGKKIKIPMFNENVRSLNLAMSVGIAVYQALEHMMD